VEKNRSLKKFSFKTKGRTLQSISGLLDVFRVPKLVVLKCEEWFDGDREEVLEQICSYFDGLDVVIRSSVMGEDSENYSAAGEFDSVLGVPTSDKKRLASGIAHVVSTYVTKLGKKRVLNEEILIQEMVKEVDMSGVVFTHESNFGGPYYVVNYDDITGQTDTVTSGSGEHANRTLFIHRGATESIRSERFKKLISAVQEVEQKLLNEYLDIEFALDSSLEVYLLQVRPITTSPQWDREIVSSIDAELQGVSDFLRYRFRTITGVFGKTTVFGQMPDWNPAEMIGRAPRSLARSLYEELITNKAWWKGREEMGYAVPLGQPLMVSLAGQPYIDVRLSFHSYLPLGLPENISNKIVGAWIDRLKERPDLHDKVEFDVAITAYTFNINNKVSEQLRGVLNKEEIRQFVELHKCQTALLVQGKGQGTVSQALEKIKHLEFIQKKCMENRCDITSLPRLLEECINFGTQPFAILARHAFIAKALLASLAERSYLTYEDVSKFQASIKTVASELVDDMLNVFENKFDEKAFMERYGHLRPGTYDILSQRYDQIPEFFSKHSNHESNHQHPAHGKFVLTDDQSCAIDALLVEEGISDIDCEKLFTYFTEAIAGREYAKFIFTRSVSTILEVIAEFGEQNGLSREEVSHIPVSEFIGVMNESSAVLLKHKLKSISEKQSQKHKVTSAIRLPQILFDMAGVHVVPFQVSLPNFITSLKVEADSILLSSETYEESLEGKIVLIENADPGYDWIFSHQFSGLITKYGGANSHMAIRCVEFGIPAAIGCGEQIYESIKKSQNICLDCSAGLVTSLF